MRFPRPGTISVSSSSGVNVSTIDMVRYFAMYRMARSASGEGAMIPAISVCVPNRTTCIGSASGSAWTWSKTPGPRRQHHTVMGPTRSERPTGQFCVEHPQPVLDVPQLVEAARADSRRRHSSGSTCHQ